MTSEELETLLEAQGENQRLDLKASVAWDVRIFARDILAMANVEDGGTIVVGVEDQTWTRQGLKAEHRGSYQLETMRDQMAVFADPHVQFDCELVKDKDGREYAVIQVREFDEVPVICRKDAADVHAGDIYYRSLARRPASARVDNSYDMRTILERAAVKMMQRRRDLGYVVEAGAREQLDAELGGL